jgi:hypothetical protein
MDYVYLYIYIDMANFYIYLWEILSYNPSFKIYKYLSKKKKNIKK